MQKIIPEVSENIIPILTRFKDSARNVYGPKLKKVILYGSYARGMAHNNSDIDLMIVLSEMESAFEEIDRLNDIKFNIGLDYEVYISTNPVSEYNFSHSKLPLYRNVAREGIEI
ncbi:MAG: nucleotidyltransferase domain-containing protein [Bacteroidales bacterium]